MGGDNSPCCVQGVASRRCGVASSAGTAMAGDGRDSIEKRAPEMAWTQAVLAQLRSRNARECGKWGTVFAELTGLRSELVAAKANQFALQREAVAASVSCPDADLSGLLADTPVAPHMREQLSEALRSQLAPRNGRTVPLDPLLVSGCDAVIACLLAASPSPSPSAAGGSGASGLDLSPLPQSPGGSRSSLGVGRDALAELRIGDLEACFAGSVCRSLVADQRSAFDLTRMHRLVAKFRALIADACYGTVLGDNDAGAAAGDTPGTRVTCALPPPDCARALERERESARARETERKRESVCVRERERE